VTLSINLVLIVATVIVSFLAMKDRGLLDRLILWPPAISRGREYYRLLSYGLVHADPAHLIFNMITLYFFGGFMEQVYGRYIGAFGYLLFYAGGLVVSILPSYLKNRDNPAYRSLGASGAVSAVLFAYVLIRPWSKIIVFVFPMPAILFAVLYIAYSIYMDRAGRDNVNHSAHLWGAAYGVLFTIAMEPRVLGAFLAKLLQPGGGP
jgi:membrane associated rhomboid family serine protease